MHIERRLIVRELENITFHNASQRIDCVRTYFPPRLSVRFLEVLQSREPGSVAQVFDDKIWKCLEAIFNGRVCVCVFEWMGFDVCLCVCQERITQLKTRRWHTWSNKPVEVCVCCCHCWGYCVEYYRCVATSAFLLTLLSIPTERRVWRQQVILLGRIWIWIWRIPNCQLSILNTYYQHIYK